MNQVYTREQLEALKRPQLWAICETLSLPKYPASAKCVEAILEKQPVKVDIEVIAVAKPIVDEALFTIKLLVEMNGDDCIADGEVIANRHQLSDEMEGEIRKLQGQYKKELSLPQPSGFALPSPVAHGGNPHERLAPLCWDNKTGLAHQT